MTNSFQAIILAAGRGSRMGSQLPKVLVSVCDKPIIEHVIDALRGAGIERPVTVIGSGGEAIIEALGDRSLYVRQDEPRGSGHAVICAKDIAQTAPNTLVMCGDSPLFRVETIRTLMDTHISEGATITLACAVLDNPHGYGRILTNSDGSVSGVIEEKMATAEQKAIREINGGCYAFNADWLWGNIHLMQKNEAGEYCLTEMVDIAISQGRKVIAVPAGADEVLGVNTPEQLAEAEAVLKSRG